MPLKCACGYATGLLFNMRRHVRRNHGDDPEYAVTPPRRRRSLKEMMEEEAAKVGEMCGESTESENDDTESEDHMKMHDADGVAVHIADPAAEATDESTKAPAETPAQGALSEQINGSHKRKAASKRPMRSCFPVKPSEDAGAHNLREGGGEAIDRAKDSDSYLRAGSMQPDAVDHGLPTPGGFDMEAMFRSPLSRFDPRTDIYQDPSDSPRWPLRSFTQLNQICPDQDRSRATTRSGEQLMLAEALARLDALEAWKQRIMQVLQG